MQSSRTAANVLTQTAANDSRRTSGFGKVARNSASAFGLFQASIIEAVHISCPGCYAKARLLRCPFVLTCVHKCPCACCQMFQSRRVSHRANQLTRDVAGFPPLLNEIPNDRCVLGSQRGA